MSDTTLQKIKNVYDTIVNISTAAAHAGAESLSDKPFEEWPEAISKINEVPTDAAATADSVLENKQAWVNGSLITGTIPHITSLTSMLVEPGATETIESGYYSSPITIKGQTVDALNGGNALPAQILKDKSAYVKGELIIGTMPNNTVSTTVLKETNTFKDFNGYYPPGTRVLINTEEKTATLTDSVIKPSDGKVLTKVTIPVGTLTTDPSFSADIVFGENGTPLPSFLKGVTIRKVPTQELSITSADANKTITPPKKSGTDELQYTYSKVTVKGDFITDELLALADSINGISV